MTKRNNRSPNGGLNKFKHCVLFSALTVAGTSVAASAVAADHPEYSPSDASFYLQYLPSKRSEPGMAHTPNLHIAFPGGATRSIEMDTGSTGIVVTADAIPNFSELPATPGKLTYNSSGRVMIGSWVKTPVTISGNNGVSFTTKPIPVLAVTEIQCLANARHCTPTTAPRGVSMMGVGFSRESSMQKQSTPETNPFLNVVSTNPMHKGYIVTRNGVHVGLNAQNTLGGFSYVKLQPSETLAGEWMAPTVCISASHQSSPACGSALVDTGVTDMFLTLPSYPAEEDNSFAPDTKLTFTFTPRVSYSINVDDDQTALSPDKIHLNTKRPVPFVNTGVRFLNGFDVLYDAEGGYYGYRPVKAS